MMSDIDEARVIFFFTGYGHSRYGQTDTVLEYSYGNMSAHKKLQLKAQN